MLADAVKVFPALPEAGVPDPTALWLLAEHAQE